MRTKILLLAALSVSIPALAGDPHICSLTGSVYETAAQARDMSMAPEQALDMSAPYGEVPLAERKQIINAVYFDSRFAHAGGAPLRMQMMDLCMNGPKNWKPLK